MTVPTNEAITKAVLAATIAQIKDYCERRIGQGATNAALNAELKQYIPAINAWSRRERGLLKLMLDDLSAPQPHELQ